MGIITKIKIAVDFISNYYKQVKLRGWIDAFLLTITELQILFSTGNKEKLYARKHKLNLCFMKKNFPISKYKLTDEEVVKDENYTIWVLWWQGEAQMPPIVKATYHSICSNARKKVVLITECNYQQYIDIPASIRDKVAKGKMRLPALSDFIRMSLLDKYGGMWIDSTILLMKPMSDTFFSKTLFSIADRQDMHIEYGTQYVSAGRWNVQLLGTNLIHYPLFQLLRFIWIDYWTRYDSLIDYLLIDYSIIYIANQINSINNNIEALPETNKKMHFLRTIINEEYNKLIFDDLLKDNSMFKLTYKGHFEEELNGAGTFYKYILDYWGNISKA